MESRALKPLKLVAMVLAGGRVGELSVLTLRRPKSALPFAGYYRIIDFALSNLMRAGITHVGILSQYRPASLIDHVGVGESWDMVGLGRGAKILPPFRGAEASDWYRGNADAVFQNLNYVRDHDADMVLIVSGDHIYTMDYQELIEHHLTTGADLTMGFKKMDPNERFGYGVLDQAGRVLRYEEKPSAPISDLASLTIYLFNREPLIRALSELRGREMVEFGRDVVPAMLEQYRVSGYVFPGYWAYTRTIEAYYQAHQDLLSGALDLNESVVRSNLYDAMIAGQPPARVGSGGRVENSFVSSGCEVEGTVIDSVISPGVRIHRDAVVRGSIVFARSTIGPGTRIERAILDKGLTIEDDVRIGGPGGGITLVGKEAVFHRGATVAPGAVVQPEDVVAAGGHRGDAA